MYASGFAVLGDVASLAFGPGHRTIALSEYRPEENGSSVVVAIPELRLPSRDKRGAYFVDWILAKLDASGSLTEFTAVEVQTIDTTGSYRPEVQLLRQGAPLGVSKAGLNWENVNKRILPQLIYKGHVLEREPLCMKGLFFICPSEVYGRIVRRIGGKLEEYGLQHSAITFLWYSLAPSEVGKLRRLAKAGQFSTTVEQVAFGFIAPKDLPPAGSYETAIRAQLPRD
jgi:hypothetical protein